MAVEFLIEEELRHFNVDVTIKKAVRVACRGSTVVFVCLIVSRINASSNRRIIRKEKNVSILKMNFGFVRAFIF